MGALFVLWLGILFQAPLALAQGCLPFRADEWVAVAHVYDGDTLKLSDGRKVRLIGINTPEIGHDGAPPEPLGDAARQAMIKLLVGTPRLALQYEQEKKDRYGRLLAHVYLDERRSLQVELLRQGLAAAVAVAPNLANVDCYLAAEKEAAGRGIWLQPRYRGMETSALPADAGGFYLLTGRVMRVAESRAAYWLHFPAKVVARIDKRDLYHFEQGFEPRSLTGKRLRLRGWLAQRKDERQLRLQHPAAMELLE